MGGKLAEKDGSSCRLVNDDKNHLLECWGSE